MDFHGRVSIEHHFPPYILRIWLQKKHSSLNIPKTWGVSKIIRSKAWMSSSSSQSLKPKSGVSVNLSLSSPSPNLLQDLKPEEKGVQLIKLLVMCAKHASSGNLFHADASLQQILELASVTGDSIQRLAARFASALAIRLIKRWPGIYKALYHQTAVTTSVDLDQARSIFAHTFPYTGFTYAIVNRTLMQAISSEESIIHIVDLGCGDPKLWIPFLRSLSVQVPKGDPNPQLRITCVHQKMAVLDQLGTKLAKEAARLGIPFQFNPVNVSFREVTSDMFKVRPGETLAFTSILNLHILLAEDDRIKTQFIFNKKHNIELEDSKRMTDFLTMISSLSPKVVLLVEQESHHNITKLPDRFVTALHYYSALFDSISASFGGSSSQERFAVEEMFGKEIENIVACEGLEREERHEPYEMWLVRLSRAGFRPVRLWDATVEDAKRLVKAFGLHGYNITNHGASLAISWHDRSIYTVSAWSCFR